MLRNDSNIADRQSRASCSKKWQPAQNGTLPPRSNVAGGRSRANCCADQLLPTRTTTTCLCMHPLPHATIIIIGITRPQPAGRAQGGSLSVDTLQVGTFGDFFNFSPRAPPPARACTLYLTQPSSSSSIGHSRLAWSMEWVDGPMGQFRCFFSRHHTLRLCCPVRK